MDRLVSLLYALAIVAFFLAFFIVGLVKKKLTPHQLHLPPGPKGLPILGSAFEIDRREPWLTFGKWSASYGEVISCNFFGQTYVILNSERAAKSLLEQRPDAYFSRSVIRACSVFGTKPKTEGLSCETTSSQQKIFHQSLSNSITQKHHDLVARTSRTLLASLLRCPESFENHMRTYSATIVMSIMYGYRVFPGGDHLEQLVEEMTQIVDLMTPERAILVNRFPRFLNFLSWFLGSEFRRLAKLCREMSPRIQDASLGFVKECLSRDIENDSLVAQLLKDGPQGRFSHEQDINDYATSSFVAGICTMQSCLKIDRVVGRDRLPDLKDRTSLPYIDALLRETLRWSSLFPMAIPHTITKDVIFEQHLIPKGSVLIQNLWYAFIDIRSVGIRDILFSESYRAMARDEVKFPYPAAFEPERHLDTDGNLLQADASGLYFGYGSSVCPGRYLADESTWLAAANMLSMFMFSKVIGPAGYETDVYPKFTGGVLRRPAPFPCRISPRFDEAIRLIDCVECRTNESVS